MVSPTSTPPPGIDQASSPPCPELFLHEQHVVALTDNADHQLRVRLSGLAAHALNRHACTVARASSVRDMWDDSTSRKYYDSELTSRLARPVAPERKERIDWFIGVCRDRQLSSVVEVGAGAGRDGVRLQDAGFDYTGVDLSDVGVDLCRSQGLKASAEWATDLPFEADSFDAGWSMSTLMHLPNDEIVTALSELQRVVRTGGVLAVGLWGSTASELHVDEHGRLFQHRTDEQVRALLGEIGDVWEFETWGWYEDGAHYQFAAVEIR